MSVFINQLTELRVFSTSVNRAVGNTIVDNLIVNADDDTVSTNGPEQDGEGNVEVLVM